jgi:hypothetical protein
MPADRNINLPDHIIQMLYRAWRRELRNKLMLAVACTAVAIGAVLYVQNAIFRVVAFAMFTISLYWVFRQLFSWNRQPPLLTALREGVEMVWIYKASLQMMPFGIMLFTRRRMYIHSIGSEEYAIDLKDTQMILFERFLQKQFPNATYGYNRERKEAYGRDPALLLRKRDSEEG